MKITLISPYYDVASIGIRTISSCLKKAGHNTQMIFLPQTKGGYFNDFLIEEDENTLQELVRLCGDSDVIGITLMTNYFFRVAKLSKRIKERLDQPLLWGGVHPTIRPGECLQYADIVFVGEAENSIVEFCDRMENGLDTSDVKGVCLKKGAEIIKNESSSLIRDLDSIPYPDYSFDNSFILNNGSIVPMDSNNLHDSLLRGMTIDKGQATYQLFSSRGCPLNCSYCCNDTYRRLNPNEKHIRARSPENIIGELEHTIKTMHFIKGIWISDDCFIYQSLEYLEKFADLYKSKINLPFFCLGDPIHVTKEKMEVLCNAGLKLMTMGIQSGSKKTKKLYKRNISNDKILETTKIINQFHSKMKPPMYDVIVDNPYENLEDQYETIKLITGIPKPYYLQLFSLTFYPETSLYKRAIEDSIITDDYEQIYNKPYYDKGLSFHNILLRLYNRNVPGFLLKILSSRGCYFLLNMKVFNFFYWNVNKLITLLKRNKRIISL